MNTAGIMALAGAYGVSLTADIKHIIGKPAAKLTPQLRETIRNHSIELLKMLTMTTDPQGLIRILARLGMRLTADDNYLVYHGTRG